MLILTRRLNEDILIGDTIVVRVIDIRGGHDGAVRLGIFAPDDVLVDRPEVRRERQRDEARRRKDANDGGAA